MEFHLYTVDQEYIAQLHNIDNKVEYHHGTHDKPYLGIILTIGNIYYFVPLSSPKEKHNRIKENISFIKLKHKGHLIAVLNINNMIPVPHNLYKQINISDIDDEKYKDLLNTEYLLCKNKKEDICKSAELVHKFICDEPNSHMNMKRYCCDFNNLENYYKKNYTK